MCYLFLKSQIILSKYCAEMENYESFRDFGYIYIYIYISRHQVQLNSVRGEKVNFFSSTIGSDTKNQKKKKILPLDSLAPSVYNTFLFRNQSI